MSKYYLFFFIIDWNWTCSFFGINLKQKFVTNLYLLFYKRSESFFLKSLSFTFAEIEREPSLIWGEYMTVGKEFLVEANYNSIEAFLCTLCIYFYLEMVAPKQTRLAEVKKLENSLASWQSPIFIGYYDFFTFGFDLVI